MRTVLTALAIVAGVAVLLIYNTFYTVPEAQQAIVLQFGRPVHVEQKPGLHAKVPFVQNVVYFDKRLLDFDADATEVIMLDQRRLVVDAFARYRITDPLLFLQTAVNEQAMRARLGAIVNGAIRNVLGSVPFSAVLSNRRGELMRQISDAVVTEAKQFGVEVYDVRIMRADLHPDNSPAIYARMQTEREREARTERAQGAEASQRIRAEAERDRTVLLAEAQRQAQVLRGQGDAESTRIFAEAFNRDPQFYSFYRSLQAYRQSIGDGTTLVLTPDTEFFRYFRDMQGAPPPPAPAGARPAVPAR